MKRILIYKIIQHHAVRLASGQTEYNFFGEAGETANESSISLLPEREIIDWIFRDPSFKHHFVREIMGSEEPVYHLQSVTAPVLDKRQSPGDIDILMWPLYKPHLAVAIECKRVKVVVDSDGNEKPSKLHEIDKGVRQVNQLREHGFHKTLLVILIVTDGRNKKQVNSFFRGADPKTIPSVYDVPWHEELHPDAGVMYVQITQPSGLSIYEMVSFGVLLDKHPQRLVQPESLTSKIRSIPLPPIYPPHK